MEDCLFCSIVSGEIPSYTVYQDEKTQAFLDINPNTRGHTLVIPKEHARYLTEMDDKGIEAVFKTVRKVVTGLQAALNPEGFNLVVNHGEVAGQIIHHFHCHIIPRYGDDGIEFNAKKVTMSEDEFINISERISELIHA